MSKLSLKHLTELPLIEKETWGEQIRTNRKKFVKTSAFLIKKALEANIPFDKNNVSGYIEQIRSIAWQFYLEDELYFHKEMISLLLEKNHYASAVLAEAISEHLDMKKLVQQNTIAKVVGQTSGILTPYLYQLCLSTTQSRRSRTGNEFELIVEHILLKQYHYPFESQARLGSKFYDENNIGKMVDVIIPSSSAFYSNRSHCVFITMKTTLRERWQEVAEELVRSNIPTVYLLTLDEDLTEKNVKLMNQHNINLVVLQSEKLRLASVDNVTSFEKFFNQTIPNYLRFWE